IDEALAQIYAASRAFNVSQSMVAYRLYKANFISKSRWDVIQNRLAAYKVKPRAKDEQETQSKGGPSYYVVRRHRLGHAVLDLVDRALNEGNISPTKAGMILGVQPRNIAPLLDFQERR
ncbi:MAG: peptidase, partial [Chloroflexi bacterium]|nr:peptidase [Chloroflexota bacterium]